MRIFSVAVILLWGCAGDANPQDSGCTPGAWAACVGAGGCSGGQECALDGLSFGPCICATDGGMVGPVDDGGGIAGDSSVVPVDTGNACRVECVQRSVCEDVQCDGDSCIRTPRPDGLSCNGGAGSCLAGECCEGCQAGGTCVPPSAQTRSMCGSGGVCESCDDGNPCTEDTCSPLGCRNTPLADVACGSGVCFSGTCQACGSNGERCCAGSSCDSGAVCRSSRCASCGEPGQPCCAGSTCGEGARCNLGAGTCEACGGRAQVCCGGASCLGGLGCYGSTCQCGGLDQVCCPAPTNPCGVGSCRSGFCRI
mgnify:CR=1 FL=1